MLKEYEQLFRNVMYFYSGERDQDQLLTGVSAEGLFTQRPELRELFDKVLAKTDPRFAANVRSSMRAKDQQ